jgi:proton-dependent oligopeptide transporter, POT family
MTADASRGFFGHPRALSTLFFAEMWERFSYYGMRALLVLFLVDAARHGGFGLDDAPAAAIYGLYPAGVYIASLPGGWIADRLIGGQRAVLWGGALITVGHLLLAVAGTLGAFCAGLAVIVLGTGLLKPNISALVAALYPEGGARRDAGFTVFYMGINSGAMLGPFVTAWLAQRYGWPAGFLAAAVGMAAGLAWFAVTRARLDAAGREPAAHPHGDAGRARDARRLLAGLAVLALLAGLYATGATGLGAVQLRGGAIWVIVTLVVGFFAYLLWGAKLTADERRRVGVLAVLFVASTVFWSGFEQAGSSMTLFAERYTQRAFGGFQIPAGWFQMLNASFIILFAPLFSALWSSLGRRHRDLSTGLKFVLGLLGMAAGFVVMAAAAQQVAAGGLAGPGWLAMAYLLHTWGELALSPIGMSATTQLVPARFTGQSLGLWYASLSLGNLVASLIAGDFDDSRIAAMPGQYLRIVLYGVVAALALAALLPRLRRATAPAQ